MADFTPRKTKPTSKDKFIKYYNTPKNGGVSLCIQGYPKDATCDVLCNCVGWSCARFNEIYSQLKNTTTMQYPNMICNAENFLDHAKEWGLKTGNTPKLGAIMCWQNDSGHVAIVEEIVSDTEVITSESQYNYFAFKNITRKKGSDGNWGMKNKYKFGGFIYNPAVPDEETYKLGDKGLGVYASKCVLSTAKKLGLYTQKGVLGNNDTFNANTKDATVKMQKLLGLPQTGQINQKTLEKSLAKITTTIETLKKNNTKYAKMKKGDFNLDGSIDIKDTFSLRKLLVKRGK